MCDLGNGCGLELELLVKGNRKGRNVRVCDGGGDSASSGSVFGG